MTVSDQVKQVLWCSPWLIENLRTVQVNNNIFKLIEREYYDIENQRLAILIFFRKSYPELYYHDDFLSILLEKLEAVLFEEI